MWTDVPDVDEEEKPSENRSILASDLVEEGWYWNGSILFYLYDIELPYLLKLRTGFSW